MQPSRELTSAELRAVQLGVLADIDRMCREQGLTYYLGYGTLLGAVRHEGYIPWDDDVDVIMLRKDYERFLDRFAAVAPPHLSLGCPGQQPGWPLPYAKVSDERTLLWEPFEVPVDLGVNVDVFPVDRLPASRVLARGQWALLRLLLWALELKYIAPERGRGWHRPVTLTLGKRLLRLLAMDTLVGVVNRVARGAGRPSDHAGVRIGSVDWSVPHTSLGRPSELRFEHASRLAPADPEAVLRAVYGDWRRLPPAAERTSHHAFTAAWRPGAE